RRRRAAAEARGRRPRRRPRGSSPATGEPAARCLPAGRRRPRRRGPRSARTPTASRRAPPRHRRPERRARSPAAPAGRAGRGARRHPRTRHPRGARAWGGAAAAGRGREWSRPDRHTAGAAAGCPDAVFQGEPGPPRRPSGGRSGDPPLPSATRPRFGGAMTEQRVPPSAPPPPPPSGFFASVRRLGIWRSQDRWAGGVAAGIARRYGVDPLLVRGILVVVTMFGGLGLVLYGLGWALLPEASDGRIHLEQA